jgi:hypothetical protein
MKYKKYMKKMKRSLLVGASGGLLAGVLLAGAGTAYAESADYAAPQASIASTTIPGMHMMRRWNSGAKAGGLAAKLGLDKAEMRQEMKSGKTLKQILQEHGIVPDQLYKAFSTHPGGKHTGKKKGSHT